jgi:hypothetical protein
MILCKFKNIVEGNSRAGVGTLVCEAPGLSTGLQRSCGRGSTKNKAAWILADFPRAISPRMRRSFVDRHYSPSIGINRSEWDIILGELIRMGYIVKQEPDD